MANPVGKPRNLKDPEQLWDLWLKYKKHVDANPIIRQHITVKGDSVEERLQAPYLFEGFICFVWDVLDFDVTDYIKGRYPEYSPIVSRMDKDRKAKNIPGAAVGIFNNNIIARYEGLVEKEEKHIKGDIAITLNLGESANNIQ